MKNIFVSQKKGNVWVGILIMMVFIISVGLVLTSSILGTMVQAKRQSQIIVAQALCEAGIEKAFWQLNQTAGSYTGEGALPNPITLPTGQLTIEVGGTGTNPRTVIATAYVPSYSAIKKVTRKVRAKITVEQNSSNARFFYGIQVGSGGLLMSNNARVNGNVYAGGPINGSNGATITLDAISSGAGGLISGENNGSKISIGGNAKAHSIQYATITGGAYYSSVFQTSTASSTHPNSPDQPNINMPIENSTINQWENWAEAGGVINGNYTIGGTQSIGPKKIDGDLYIDTGIGNTLTINGTLWVTGNITINVNSTIRLNPSFGEQSGMIVADSPTDPAGKGKIVVSNNVTVLGSGNPKSSIMFISTNTGGIGNPAINAGNNSTAVIYYTNQGFIEISQNARVKAMSGNGIHLSNGAIVDYDSGLANMNFSGGPGGSWQITEWQVCPLSGNCV